MMTTTAIPSSLPRVQPRTPTDVRSANIFFELTEDRNSSVWNVMLSNALHHVAGQPVEISDAFESRSSVLLKLDLVLLSFVKLRNVWDRRLVLSNAHKLCETVEFRRIGFAADKPIKIRRKNTMKRLHYKANQEGKLTSLSASRDSLLVDGVFVSSLKDCFTRNGANVRNTSSQSNKE